MTQQATNTFEAVSEIRVSEATAEWFRFWVKFHKLWNDNYSLIDNEQGTLPDNDAQAIREAFDNLNNMLLGAISRTIEEVHSHTSCPDDLM